MSNMANYRMMFNRDYNGSDYINANFLPGDFILIKLILIRLIFFNFAWMSVPHIILASNNYSSLVFLSHSDQVVPSF